MATDVYRSQVYRSQACILADTPLLSLLKLALQRLLKALLQARDSK
jgi:hypothetical protein